MKIIFTCIAIIGIFAFSNAQIITTVAGNGITHYEYPQGQSGSYSGDGGQATLAGLNDANGIVFDALGNLYIADQSNQRIRKVDTFGIINTVAGNGSYGFYGDGGQATSAKLNNPQGVAVDLLGNLYIADCYNNRIRKVNTSGKISTIAGNGTAGYNGDGYLALNATLHGPIAIAVDVTGNIYFADIYNYRVRKISTSGIITTVAGDSIEGYNGDGGLASNSLLNAPTGVAIDAKGNLFIADRNNNRIRKVDTLGIITTVAGNGIAGYSGDGGPATAAKLNWPLGVTVDPLGNIYFTERYNSRVRKVDTLGIITTIAGSGVQGYGGDGGPATAAEFYGIWGIAFDNTGNLHVADMFNYRIRKISNVFTDLKQITNSNIHVVAWPNPVNSILNIESSTKFSQLIVSDILGNVVIRQQIYNTTVSIDLSGLGKGFYFVKLVSENGSFVKKFFKE